MVSVGPKQSAIEPRMYRRGFSNLMQINSYNGLRGSPRHNKILKKECYQERIERQKARDLHPMNDSPTCQMSGIPMRSYQWVNG
jgi:hypothetical protein